jgi:hypothetical protein
MTTGSRTKDECSIIPVFIAIRQKNATFLVLASQGPQIMNREELNQVVAFLVDSTRQLGLNAEAEALG